MKKNFYSVITVVILLFIICGIVMISQNRRISVTTPANISFFEENPDETSMFFLDIDAINGTVSKLSIDGLPRASLYIVSEKKNFYLAVNLSARFVPCYWGYNCPTPVIPKGLMANGNMVAEDSLTGELVVISPVRDMGSISSITEIAVDEAEAQIVYKVVLD